MTYYIPWLCILGLDFSDVPPVIWWALLAIQIGAVVLGIYCHLTRQDARRLRNMATDARNKNPRPYWGHNR